MVYTERDLIIPALQVIKEEPGIHTSDLIKKLEKILKPTGHNGELLPGRQDTHFSQKVRNLKSHDTLERMGAVIYDDGHWTITEKGEEYLDEGPKVLESLEWQGIKKEEITEDIEDFSKIIIEEGAVAWRKTEQRQRSATLKKKAIEDFKNKNENRLFCMACSFNFGETYGEWGEGFIEIHHLKPISTMDLEGDLVTLEKALQKVVPLCSNCHRMVHRKKGKMLSLDDLKELLKKKE